MRKRKLLGWRSGTPWKAGLALAYFLLCACFLVIALTTAPLIPAGQHDTLVYRLSSCILFLWLLSPAIFLSDTRLRDRLPFFKDRQRLRSLTGMLIVSMLFFYLFFLVEGWHTQTYKDSFRTYIETTFETFVEAGTPGA